VTDPSFEDTEQRVREAMKRIADSHRPDTDGHWPASHPNRKPSATPSSSTNRWMLAAASIVVVAGLAAVVVVQLGGNDPATDLAPAPIVVDSVDDLPATTLPTEPTNSVPDSKPAEELGGVRFPVDATEEDVEWIVPWDDGFLAGSFVDPDDGGATTVRARFTTDGESWEPVEITMPPGMIGAGRITTAGDRFVMAAAIDPTADADVYRVASTTDLLNWSVQDFDVPGPRPPQSDQSELGASFSSMGSFAANETGWTFEIRRVYTDDVAVATLGDDIRSGGYQIRSDDNGFIVAVNAADGSPPTPDTTFEYTWGEVGIGPEGVPFMTGEIPASRTWAATWDSTPAVSETAVPSGPTLASSEGFVRWNDQTWFSADGLTWSASPLPDPAGTIQNAFPVDAGFVAFMANQDGATDVYRLDERGGTPRRVDIDDVPEQFSTAFAGQTLPGPQSPQASVALLYPGPNMSMLPPLIIDKDGYRYVERSRNISVIDLTTGETLHTFTPLDGPPGADTWFGMSNGALTLTDPATETVLAQIPLEELQAARNAQQETLNLETVGDESVEDFSLLASRDGERFLLEPLRSSNPDTNDLAGVFDASTNGNIVLVRLGDEWIRYDLPS